VRAGFRYGSPAMTRTTLAPLLALSLAACGGGAATTTTTTTGDGTSGGEVATAETHPIRTTTPIPFPRPAIAREQMSPELQRVWELVEVAVAIRPPEPPSDASVDGVTAWAQGPFSEWLGQRAQAAGEIQEAIIPLEEAPAHERGVAAGLLGYLYETTVADVRGAPIPDSIASDPELLGVYDRSMNDALLPTARISVQAYRFCGAAFEEANSEQWGEWSTYCSDRAADVGEVFGVATDASPPDASQPVVEE